MTCNSALPLGVRGGHGAMRSECALVELEGDD